MMNLENYQLVLRKRLRQYKAYIGFALIFWAIGNIILKDYSSISDSTLGFINGLTLGIEIVSVFWVFRIRKALRYDNILRELYIKEFDERENLVKLKSGSILISKIAITIFLFSIITSFFNIVVFYTLVITGISIIMVSLFLKLYRRKTI